MADSEQSAAAAAAPVYTNVGQLLREARVAKDLTVDQLATELRIEARQLAALEENRFEQIGPSVFIKGYIRQYAQRLGLNQGEVMDVYNRQTNITDVQVKPSRPIRLRDERQITVWIVGALVLLLIVVGLALWWLNGGTFDFGSLLRSANTPTSRVEPAKVAPVEPARPQAPAAEPPAVAQETQSPQKADTTTAPAEARPTPAPVTAAPSPALAVTQVSTLAPAGGGASRGATPISLDVTFDAESWAEITDARGQRLFFELGTVGRHVVMRGEPPISVTFGNADAVRMLVDGERYTIPTQERQGKLVRFSIGSDEE